MKKLLLVLLALPTFAFGAEFNAMTVKPNILELKKYLPVHGRMELRYVHETPRIVIKIATHSKDMADFYKTVLASDLNKIYCDGDFNLSYDNFGTQFIVINSIKSCVDEDGSMLAHSIGMNQLSDKDVAASMRYIELDRRPLAVTNPAVNDSALPKQDISKAGVFSSKLSPTSSK